MDGMISDSHLLISCFVFFILSLMFQSQKNFATPDAMPRLAWNFFKVLLRTWKVLESATDLI